MAAVPEGQGKVRLRVENRNTDLRRLHLVLGVPQDGGSGLDWSLQ